MWFGLNDMRVSAFKGRAARTGAGASFAGQDFDGAFVGRNAKGRQNVMRRVSKSRWPVKEERMSIEDKAQIYIEDEVFDEIEEITDNPLVFYGAISRVVLEFKIPIIPTPSASHTAKLLVSMCSKKDGPTGPYLKKIKKSSNLETQQLSTLCSLPGIGEKFAIRMLEKFGTPSKVFSATTSELAKVEGLGEARAKKIKNMLTTKNKLQKESNQKTLT